MLAALIGSLRDFDLAEEAFSDAIEAAMQTWPRDGVPDNPAAWLTTTARRRAIDRLRHLGMRADKAAELRLAELQRRTEQKERERIASAKEILTLVQVSDSILTFISKLCAEHEVDGLRADIVIYKAAQTLAAYEGRTEATIDDVLTVAEMALLHRMRRQPFDDPEMNREKLQEMAQEILDDQQEQNNQSQPDLGDAAPPEPPPTDDQSQGGSDENVFPKPCD